MKQIEIPVIGRFIGAYINILYNTMPLLGIITYAGSFMTLYTVNLSWIHEHFPWMSLPIFIVFIIIGGHFIMLLNFLIIYRAYYRFLNGQIYKHDNPMQRDLQLIKTKLGITKQDEQNLQ